MVKPVGVVEQPRQASAGNNGGSDEGQKPSVTVPFIGGSRQRIEGAFHDKTEALQAASTTTVSNIGVPTLGFLHSIVLKVEATGGDGSTTAAVPNEDAPWNVFDRLELADVNGNSILAPVSGFIHYLNQKYGANIGWVYDPKLLPSFSGVDSNGDFSFLLTIPVVSNPLDMLGVLENKNDSQQYGLHYVLNQASSIYDTQPGGLPSVRVRAWVVQRTTPEAQSPTGVPQETTPPANGTTQYLSRTTFNVGSGDNDLHLRRKGNIIRYFMGILRDTNGARSEADWPSTLRLEYNGNMWQNTHVDVLRDAMARVYGYTDARDAAGGLDSGVLVWPFMDDGDGRAGYGQRRELFPTSSADRIILSGEFGSNADSVDLVTQDLSIP